ncbi:hypothetical protein [Algibacter aquimarinus]|uniref:Adhesin domain-containing protein n=1 Tax=Algibacter aquimarinus TaxID=1136748 RepID=A0ABP9HNZ4_9FLAO
MNNTIIKIKLFVLSFLITGSLLAQNKLTKLSQSIKVDKDVTIDLNTSYTNIIFDTWNKGNVEIEAYIEGEELSKEELEDALKSWDIDVDASTNKVSISTKGSRTHTWVSGHNQGDTDVVKAVLEELKFELADLSEMNFDFHFEMPELQEFPEMPELPELPEMPELPELPEGVNKIIFDYSAYKKDGDKYLEEYSKQFESTFGKEYAEKMEAWGEKFGEEWGEKYGKQMQEWAKRFEGQFDNEEFAKKMELWGERYAKQIEQKAKLMEKQVERKKMQKELLAKRNEERAKMRKELAEKREKHMHEREKLTRERKVLIEKLMHNKTHSKVKKTIKIKMPKGAKLKVNVRHGELEFASNVDNLRADLSHSKFTAYSINGSSTSINASYTPIYVTNWNLGELNLKYVKKANLSQVKSLVLTSNSSDVTIDNLNGNALIDASIGDLKILEIDDAFTNLNVVLQNCDAVIMLPKVDTNFQYKGLRSRLSHPKKTSKENVSSFTLNDSSAGKTIAINAKYSNVITK